MYEQSEWKVTLRSEDELIIYADGCHEENSDYVFQSLVVGTPPTLHTVARIPVRAVREYETTYVGRADLDTP